MEAQPVRNIGVSLDLSSGGLPEHHFLLLSWVGRGPLLLLRGRGALRRAPQPP